MIKRTFKFSETLLNSYGTFFYFFCQWLITVLVVRLSGYKDAGILSFVISTTNIFYCFALYGVRNYQVSDVKEKFSDTDYLGVRLITIFGTGILFLFFLRFMSFDVDTLHCMLVYILYKFGEAISDLLFGFYQKFSEYKEIAISYTLKGILTLVTFCIVLYFTKSLFLALLVNVIFYYLILLFFDYKNLKKLIVIHWNRFQGLPLIKICFPLMLYTCMVPYLNFITRYVIRSVYGTSQLGYYSSVTMVFSVLGTLMNSIYVTILPRISNLYYENEYKKIKIMILKMLLFLFLLSIAGIFLGDVLGDFLFCLVFGEEILPYMYLLPLTIVSSIILTSSSFLNSILIAFRKNNVVFLSNFISCVVLTFSVFIFIKTFGMVGSLYSIALSLTINTVISLVFIRYILK